MYLCVFLNSDINSHVSQCYAIEFNNHHLKGDNMLTLISTSSFHVISETDINHYIQISGGKDIVVILYLDSNFSWEQGHS